MKHRLSRRNFVRSSAIVAAAIAAPKGALAFAPATALRWTRRLPVRLGLASYTFRNFTRAQLIGFMKQLNVLALNAKDVKDHLPMDPQEEDGRARGLRRGRHQAARCGRHLLSPKTKMPTSAASSNTASERAFQ